MTDTFQAVFENGALHPLQPLDLREHELVSLSLVRTQTNGDTQKSQEQQLAARQRAMLLDHVAKMEAAGDKAAADGLSNRDHDRLIYGS